MNTLLILSGWDTDLRASRQELLELMHDYRKMCADNLAFDRHFAKKYMDAKKSQTFEQTFPYLHLLEGNIGCCIKLIVSLQNYIRYYREEMTAKGISIYPVKRQQLKSTARHQLITPWYRFIYFLDYELN